MDRPPPALVRIARDCRCVEPRRARDGLPEIENLGAGTRNEINWLGDLDSNQD